MQDRKGFIGGSDAKRILDGDWFALYAEKMGLAEPEDLSYQFNVQLGNYTEYFHAEWLTMYHGFDLLLPPNRTHMARHPMLTALIDRWCEDRNTFVEIKHSNGRATRESMLEWYQPQMAHYCNVMDVDHGWLSFIAGNEEPDFFKVTPSQAYRDELIEHELRFWWHVENSVPPDIIPNASLERTVAIADRVLIDDMRAVNMTGNNAWATGAADYILMQDSAAIFEKAKKDLKALVDKDVREASGHGIRIKRDAGGSLRFSMEKT